MKEGFDREMDSLLRRRARGTAESRLWGDGWGDGSPGAHLDADELGAFAEGALPAAARLAAATHLADCDRCRGVVVGLARVTGGGAELKKGAVAIPASTESARPSAWRAFVASLFAPRVLRYAAPVLALSLVGVVSYMVIRTDNGAGLQMARDAGRRPGVLMERPNASSDPSANSTNANASLLAEQNPNAAPNETATNAAQPSAPRGHGSADAPRPAETEAVTADSDEAPPVAAAPASPAPPAVASEGPAEISKAAPKSAAGEEAEDAKADNRERSDTKDKSQRVAEPVDDATLNDLAVQQRRAANSRMNQMPDGGTNTQKRGADNNASQGYGNVGGAGTAAPPRDSERAGARSEAAGRSRAARRQPEKKAEEDDTVRSGETRSAAGHRFRREGNVWVDVNYRPSMSSTGVRRGTEPFRALVADVPEVGRVAEALGGEVVVVVKGRAYRIR